LVIIIIIIIIIIAHRRLSSLVVIIIIHQTSTTEQSVGTHLFDGTSTPVAVPTQIGSATYTAQDESATGYTA
jgi:hypothetical protein